MSDMRYVTASQSGAKHKKICVSPYMSLTVRGSDQNVELYPNVVQSRTTMGNTCCATIVDSRDMTTRLEIQTQSQRRKKKTLVFNG